MVVSVNRAVTRYDLLPSVDEVIQPHMHDGPDTLGSLTHSLCCVRPGDTVTYSWHTMGTLRTHGRRWVKLRTDGRRWVKLRTDGKYRCVLMADDGYTAYSWQTMCTLRTYSRRWVRCVLMADDGYAAYS